ncbi:MAG TPA: dihydropteroate synthase, partial [Flavisolibacter sp.]
VMGILNITPDSFYAGSRVHDASDILFRAGQMITEGAAILDIGGQSTRPGSEPVGVEEELQRVIPAIEIVRKEFPRQLISVDTYYARVAAEAVAAGASIVNDVSAGAMDDELISTVASLRVPYVLMHMKGHPQTMQMNPEYENVTREVFDSLQQQLPILSSAGIADIIVDPGFGFGKTIAHNFTLLGELHLLAQLEKPVLVGISRKSTIYKTLGITAAEALNGTTVLHTIALLNGASILRVHDVREAVQAIRLVKACTDKKQLTELLFTLPHG